MPRHTPLYTPLDRPGRLANHTGPFRRPTRVLRWVALLALMGLLFLGIQNAYPALRGSDLFLLEHISVVGNLLLTPEEVVARSGLETGGNLFEADLAAATQRLGSHPVIRRALLLRQPPETLVVSVEERRLIALVLASEGILGLDCEGTLFALPQVPLDLPVITGVQVALSDSAGIGYPEELSALIGFVETLCGSAPEFWETVSEIHVESASEARVYMVGGGPVLRMRLDNADVQVRSFQAYTLAAYRHRAAPAYVDLRFRDQVVVGRR